MAAFRFAAADNAGKEQAGVLEADSARAARQVLRARGLVPLTVEPVVSEAQRTGLTITLGRRLSQTELAVITRQLASLLGASLPVADALTVMVEQSEKQSIRELMAAIQRDLGGWDQFRTRFEQAANTQFGSGWAFVTVARDGKLAIVQKPNQDTPLMEGQRVLMGNDVWEHAYYLRYQNRRPEYTRNWWNVLNWDAIAQRYAAAKAGTLKV